MSSEEARARVYWDLMQEFKGKKKIEETDAPQVASRILQTLSEIAADRRKMDDQSRYLIIDGHNLFIRNWVANPTMDINGEHIGGFIGFLRSLKSLIKDNMSTTCIVVWDGEGGSRKRRTMDSEYKSGRKIRTNREYDFENPDSQQENMISQLSKLRRYLEKFGITQITCDDIEADDTISYICKYYLSDIDKVVVSSDKDLFQLIDNNTKVYTPTKKLYYSTKEMLERFKVLPENYVFMKALTGDKSDSIIGFKGFGEKTVAKLFPFLGEKPVDLSEVISFCEANANENPKYKQILDERERFVKNVQIMQLVNPIASPQTASKIRWALNSEIQNVNITEVKLAIIKDGIQIMDSDLFSTFRDLNIRNKKQREKNK